MEEKESNGAEEGKEARPNPGPRYQPPKIITYTSEEILEEIGPAQACSPSPCGIP